jgi:hypothetical protein
LSVPGFVRNSRELFSGGDFGSVFSFNDEISDGVITIENVSVRMIGVTGIWSTFPADSTHLRIRATGSATAPPADAPVLQDRII